MKNSFPFGRQLNKQRYYETSLLNSTRNPFLCLFYNVILHKSLDDGEFASLSKSDWNQIRFYELARTVRLEDVYFQYQRGLIDEVAYNFSLAMATSRLPTWKWLKIADSSPEFSKAIEAYVKDEDFKQTLLAAKFQEWTDENPSPFGGLSSPFHYE